MYMDGCACETQVLVRLLNLCPSLWGSHRSLIKCGQNWKERERERWIERGMEGEREGDRGTERERERERESGREEIPGI